MINISFISPYGTPSKLLDVFARLTPHNLGQWKHLKGVDTPENADCIVALDTIGTHALPSNLSTNQQIIHFRREPDLINRFHPLPNSKFMDYSDGTFHVINWWISNSYDSLQTLPYSPKPKKLSTVVSAKWEHRNSFFKNLSSLIKFDAYGGYGIKDFVGSNYQRPVKNKEDGIKDYSYSIALENSSQQNYFTEKIADCLLLWTVPIYWGCPNIGDFFPKHSYYNIDLDKPEDVIDIINRPIEKRHIEAMKEARDLILNKYNIWPAIEALLK
jgi:hypothetical protein